MYLKLLFDPHQLSRMDERDSGEQRPCGGGDRAGDRARDAIPFRRTGRRAVLGESITGRDFAGGRVAYREGNGRGGAGGGSSIRSADQQME